MKLLQKHKELLRSGIYCIENIVSGKKYVGSSVCIYHRLKRHLSDLRKKKHRNPILQSSFNKNGEKNFIAYVVEFCNIDILTSKEEFFIKEINPYFNIIKINLGRVVISEDSKLKISKTLKAKYKAGMKTFDHPDKKVSIDVYDMKGMYINTYESIQDCARKLEIRKQSINACLSGKNHYGYGYQFKRSSDKQIISNIENVYGNKLPIKVENIITGEIIFFPTIQDVVKTIPIPNTTLRRYLNIKVYKNKYKFSRV